MDRGRRTGGRLRRAWGLAALLLLAAPAASAHAYLASADPAPDARLAQAPAELRLTFTEAVEHQYTRAQASNATGARFDQGAPVFPPGTANELRVPLRPLPPGRYTVAWASLSVDGHTVQGTYDFFVQNGTAAAGAQPAPLHGHAAAEASVFLYLGLALMVGIPFFALAVDRDRTGAARFLADLAFPGALAAAVGSALLTLDLVQRTNLATAAVLLGTGAGAWGLVRTAACVAGGVVLLRARGLRDDRRRQDRLLAWGLALGGLAILATSLSSHAAALLQDRWLAILTDLLHLAAGGVWFGGVVGLAFVLAGTERPRAGALVRAFSPWAMGSVAALLATGTYAAYRHLANVQQLWTTAYGAYILAKVALFTILVVLGALNRFILGPRLDRGAGQVGSLARSVRVEAALLALVFCITGFLTAAAPPAAGT